jgi:succinoglycan biosynthesis protein ExoA
MQQTSLIQPRSSKRPLVSVILATYNEARFIESCLVSILSQQATIPGTGDFEIEVLAVDGISHDGTRNILDRYAARDPRVRVIANERRRTPFAFNLGLQHARGEYVCIFGAHSVYRDDYIAVCLAELVAHSAAGCGGRVVTVPAGTALGARLSAWTMSHPFGSSRKSFRTQSEGAVDTVNYPVLQRDLVLAAGGYDVELTRNQDNDLSQKLRARGHILYCTWKTQCLYFPKPTVSGLLRYGFTNGYWNVLSLRKNPASMAARHFVPLVFVLCLLVTVLVAVSGALLPPPYALPTQLPLAVLLGMHLGLGSGVALQLAVRDRSLGALCLPAIFLGFHFAYGYGTLSGFVSRARDGLLPKQQPHQGSVPFVD